MEHIKITKLSYNPRIYRGLRIINKLETVNSFMADIVTYGVGMTGLHALYQQNYWIAFGCILFLVKQRLGPVTIFEKTF